MQHHKDYSLPLHCAQFSECFLTHLVINIIKCKHNFVNQMKRDTVLLIIQNAACRYLDSSRVAQNLTD